MNTPEITTLSTGPAIMAMVIPTAGKKVKNDMKKWSPGGSRVLLL